MKSKIVFFSRSLQEVLLPLLQSNKYESIHVTLTKKEKVSLEKRGFKVDFCFETYNKSVDSVQPAYLNTSYFSDRFLNKHKIDKRLIILKKEIAFWTDVLDTYKPIAVLNEQVAIEIAEVLFIEANKRDIKYLAWMANPVNGYFYWISDPMSLSLNENFFINEPTLQSQLIAEEYVKRIIEKNERPYYLNPFLNQNKFRNLYSATKWLVKTWLKEFSSQTNSYEDNKQAVSNYFERALKSFNAKYNELSDFNNYEVILYPLHYEPEASLSYLSEFFSNQIALIENISKCLTINQILVVKEHPAQPGMLQTSRYQNLLKHNSCLYYLPFSMTSFEVIKKASLIVTLTSHLGWEALILGKPVFLFGKMFYDKYPNINKFSSFEELREKIRSGNYKQPSKETLIVFIAQLLDISYKGMPFIGDELYDQKNLKNLVFAIENELSLI